MITAACRVAYELAVVLVVALLLTLPVHRATVRHLDVLRTLADDAVELPADGLAPGDALTVWRFQPGWKAPLGEVRVRDAAGGVATATFDPEALRWPMGRHGRVIEQRGWEVVVDIGEELGLVPGDELSLYRGRQRIGALVLEEVAERRATGRLRRPVDPAVGAGVSEYTVRTQVTAGADDALATAVEAALVALVGGAWLAVALVARRWPLDVVGASLRRLPRPGAAWGRAAAGIAGGCVLGTLGPSVAAWSLDRAAAWLELAPIGAAAAVRPWLGVSAALAALAALVVARRRDPVRALRDLLAWRRSAAARLPPQGRRLALWTLHLVVAWAFASTLWGFLQANLAQALAVGWPDAPEQFPSFARALAHVLTHAPRLASAEDAFELAKYALWSATIVGCLVGYLHTLVSPLWGGDKLRELDFTIPGWVTNALCYPLLGPALWTLLPEQPGLDPLVVGGLPHGLAMVAGFWLNLLYTLSIWGMGTRFGVMVDKGLVDRGFHGVVRHPSYALEAAMFVVLEVVGLTTWRQWWTISGWFLLYWMRSEREDDFMGEADPDYAAYRERVPYKYLPGVW